jgi:O-antigen/teichoic acid export membrane protein
LVSRLINSQLFRSAGIYTVANALNSAIPLLLLPVLSRYLSPHEYGLVSMFTVMTAIGMAIIGLGTHGAITKEYYHLSQEKFSEFVGTCIFILATSAVALLALIILFNQALSGLTGITFYWLTATVLMGVGQLVCTIGLVIWQVRGLPKIYGTFQIILSLLNALLSLALVIWIEMGWRGRVIGQIAAVTIMGILVTIILSREGWIRFRYRREYARQALRFGVPLVFHALGATAIAMADRTLIAKLVSLNETGLYVVASQVVMLITFLADSFNRAYAPWLFERLKNGGSAVRRNIVIGTYWYCAVMLLLAGLLVIASPLLFTIVIGPKFSSASTYVPWLALAASFGGMYYMVTLYIQYSGKTERLAAVTISVGIINIFLCYALIRLEGGIGAAHATAISQLLMFLATWWVAARLIDMDWFLRGKPQN